MMKKISILLLSIGITFLFAGCVPNDISSHTHTGVILSGEGDISTGGDIESNNTNIVKENPDSVEVATTEGNISLYQIYDFAKVPENAFENKNQSPYGEILKKGTVVYQYTYTYPLLQLKITTPWLYSIDPDTEAENPLFMRENNKVFTNKKSESITMYEKDAQTSIKDIVLQRHLNTGCQIVPEKISKFFANAITGYVVIPESGGFDSRKKECYPDTENNENYMLNVYFFASEKDPTKYYKFIFQEACAPGPCSLFSKIEIL